MYSRPDRLLVVAAMLVLTANVFAVYTAHVWDVNTSGEYSNQTMYVKGPYSGGPDNSPLHESWNLTDEYIDGSPNPHFIGGPNPGLFYRFIFYDGTLHIDPTGKVGFWEKMFASGDDSTSYPEPQTGTVTVEGTLFGPELRPWKNGCAMELNLMDNGLLEISNILRVGVSDGGVNTGVFNLSGGLAKLNNLDIYGNDSYIDITGGELLILNSNWSEADAYAAILANKIVNTSGRGLEVTTKTVDSSLYTSITPGETDPCIPPADYSVRVHCAGRRLADGNDNELQLRGIYSRATWILDGGCEQDIVRLKSWGCNFMRISVPFDTDYWNTVNGGVFDINKRGIFREEDLLKMDQVARWCENNKMYFILCQQPTYQGFDFDLLQYSPTDPALYAQQMAAAATILAQRYGAYNYLLAYEPFGEPDGIDTSAERDAYKLICTSYVDAIRAVDLNRIVSIASCHGYAHPSYFTSQTRVERPNIMYTFSYYPCRSFISYQPYYGDMRYPDDVPDFYRGRVIWLDDQWLWTYGMVDAGDFSETWNVPVYCHEFGAWGNGQWNGSSPDNSSSRYMQDMVHLFEDNYMSWIIWRWQTNAVDVPAWWKSLWAGEPNNRAVIEPHGGEFVGTESVSIHAFVTGADVRYTTDGSEPDVNSTLYTAPFTIASDTTVKARVIKAGLVNPPVDTAVFEDAGAPPVTLSNANSGLRYWYYSGNWNAVPDFDRLQADSTGFCTNVSPYQSSISSGKALLWKGYISVPAGAVYYFNSRVDAQGGMQMYIDDKLVILNGANTGTGTTYSVGQIALEAGLHPMTLGYTWPDGASSLFDIEIQRPSDSSFVNIPSSMYYRNHAAPQSASVPDPADEQGDVPVNRDLKWASCVDAVSHDVYFGTTNPPPFIRNQTGAVYDPGIMEPNETYFWRVDEKNSFGTTTGPVWSFTSGSQYYMLGWWKFDESYSTTAADSSGSDNHGQLINMDSNTWSQGRNGNALNFDGYDDYVWVPYDPTLDLGTGDFSISLWAKKDSVTTGDTYLYNQRLDGYNWFYVQWRSTNVIQAVAKISGTEELWAQSSSPLSANTWYHIVLVVDKDSAANTKIYINSVDDTAGTSSVSPISYSLGAGVSIGRWSGGSGENFDGIIDDIRVLSWALNENEIADLYDYGFIRGDINRDDVVNILDFSALAGMWGQTDCTDPDWCRLADIDRDGGVDAEDLMTFCENWLNKLY